MKKHWFRTLTVAALAAGVAGSACDLETLVDAINDVGVRLKLRGGLAVTGVPADQVTVRLTAYGYVANQAAIDETACSEDADTTGLVRDCYGALNVDLLSSVAGSVEVRGNVGQFEIPNVQIDGAYFIVAMATAPNATCTTEVVGFDANSPQKLITRESLITPLRTGNAATLATSGAFEIGASRAISINCSASSTPQEDDVAPPPPPPAPVPDQPEDEAGNLPTPPNPSWSRFQLRNKAGALLADASTANVPGADDRDPCGSSRPLEVFATVDDFGGATTAYIHIQEGLGDEATIRSLEVPLSDGQIEAQTIQLSGGYARIQMDLNPIDVTSFEAASYFIEVCDREGGFNWPAQELLVVTSWNTDRTDVDSHLWVTDGTGQEDHIWYARKNGRNAQLDVDDVDGFGPETITSLPGRTGLTYDFRIHYYSDRGNNGRPQTDVTVRVIYANQSANVFCDITRVVPDFRDRAWGNIGVFGPDLVSLATSDPARFSALGCIRPR
jgi:hypothetical protein